MNKKDIFLGLIAALILAGAISIFASSRPDGLERVAEDKGFIARAEVRPAVASPIPGYVWPGLENEKLATSLAGIFGTLVVFGFGYWAAVLMRRRKYQ